MLDDVVAESVGAADVDAGGVDVVVVGRSIEPEFRLPSPDITIATVTIAAVATTAIAARITDRRRLGDGPGAAGTALGAEGGPGMPVGPGIGRATKGGADAITVGASVRGARAPAGAPHVPQTDCPGCSGIPHVRQRVTLTPMRIR